MTDKPTDTASRTGLPRRARWTGEVAILALWKAAAAAVGISEGDRDLTLGASDGGTRGARFKQALLETLDHELGHAPGAAVWTTYPELRLAEIRGMHLRQDIGTRKSDIAVVRDGALAAIVSSKWTWRSDRGTEGAQILFLKRYRPDVPYVLVTNEFVRAAVVAQESVEDAAFFMCPRWIGANVAAQTAVTSGADPVSEFPRLSDLAERADDIAAAMNLKSLADLAAALVKADTIT